MHKLKTALRWGALSLAICNTAVGAEGFTVTASWLGGGEDTFSMANAFDPNDRVEREGTGYGLAFGWDFGEKFGMELAYRDHGSLIADFTELNFTVPPFDPNLCPGPTCTVVDDQEYGSLTSLGLTVIGRLPVGADWTLFGKLGVTRSDEEGLVSQFTLDGGSLEGTHALVGIGIAWRMSAALDLQLEIESFDSGNADLGAISVALLGLRWHP